MTNNENSRVAIVGAGAVGGYYGARLAESGLDVRFLLRSDYEHVMKHGFQIQSVAGDFSLPGVSVSKSSEEIGEVDVVIIAWKTTANEHYNKVITPLLHKETVIITLQNGLGNVEELSRLFGAERVFGGLCFVCINKLSPGVISHTASGLIRLGKYSCGDKAILGGLVRLLCDGGIKCEAVDDLEKAQWMKLVWNIPFNGLTISEGGIDTAELLEMEGMEERVLRIMKEVQSVGKALGHEIEDCFLTDQVRVTKLMGKYRPSSMIDFVEGRAVELASIWGKPLKVAKSIGVDTPEIQYLLDKVAEVC